MGKDLPIPVVCAVIEKDGRVLLAQRSAHKHLALKWEFAGGKVEEGESPEMAIVREIREELGCSVEIIGSLPRRQHRYGNVWIEMIPFVCHLASDSPEPSTGEHLAVAWVAPGDVNSFDLAEADLPVIAAYLSK